MSRDPLSADPLSPVCKAEKIRLTAGNGRSDCPGEIRHFSDPNRDWLSDHVKIQRQISIGSACFEFELALIVSLVIRDLNDPSNGVADQ